MKIKVVPIALAAVFMVSTAPAFSAKNPPKLDIKALAEAFPDLRDPSSLQVRNLSYKQKAQDTWVVCGEFNAKNAFGGYVGFQRFSGITGYLKDGKTVTYFIPARGEVAEKMCADEGL